MKRLFLMILAAFLALGVLVAPTASAVPESAVPAGSGSSSVTNFYNVDDCSAHTDGPSSSWTYFYAKGTNYDHTFVGYTQLGQQYHLAAYYPADNNGYNLEGWDFYVWRVDGVVWNSGTDSNPWDMNTYKNYGTDYVKKHTFMAEWRSWVGGYGWVYKSCSFTY